MMYDQRLKGAQLAAKVASTRLISAWLSVESRFAW